LYGPEITDLKKLNFFYVALNMLSNFKRFFFLETMFLKSVVQNSHTDNPIDLKFDRHVKLNVATA